MSLTVLDGSTFCVCDERGDVDGIATASGFFASDTRFLSRSVLTLGGARLDPLSHDHSAPHLASFVLRNPLVDGLQPNELVIERERFVGDCMEERIVVQNCGQRRIKVALGLELAADFADIFVVKDLEPGFGRPIDVTLPSARPPVRTDNGTLVFSDGSFAGRTVVHFSESFDEADGVALFTLALEPGASWRLVVGVQAELEGVAPLPPALFEHELDYERRRAEQSMSEWQSSAPVLSARWDDLVHTWNRSFADLASLRMQVPEVADGQLFAAGTPWFMTVFGRDTLISSLQTLLLGPELATGTLRVLAATQATTDDPDRDAEPGKIIHELRRGKAALAWTDRYYGTVDATPLFLVLLSEVWRWTDDPTLPLELEDSARRALAWIDGPGDGDGDGFVEYERRSAQGIRNQTWKDSEDSMAFHDGTLALAPIAPAEVQGYVYDAKLRMAEIARDIWRDDTLAERLEGEAADLRRCFDEAFWLEDRGFYALGLDREKRPLDSLTSNLGHLLWSGIVPESKREAIADKLMGDALWSGWGVRTMAVNEGAYNPLVYHDGTVWPHDNSLVAWGLAQVGRPSDAARIFEAMVEAATHFDYRLPEVFAGFSRQHTAFPVVYPTASSPQAWAAGTPVLLLQAVLRLVPDRAERVLRSEATWVPEWLEGLSLTGVHAFGRRWTVRVEGGAVSVESSSATE
ncbi:MAG TPA: glycogen debranching N-terminal domain-containing protein [Gaiellaceae bacterium]|nr:glycogen debranching N-terminal domain-containing protein [Gaiellaceae bacterium]